MFSKIEKFFILSLTLAVLSNCGSQNSRNNYQDPYSPYNRNVEAVTPVPAPTNFCLTNFSNSNCNRYYSQFNGYGFMNYPFNNVSINQNFSGGFCGCPTNYRPIYNSDWGLGCMEGRFAHLPLNNSYSYMSFFWNPQNSQWTNQPQVPSPFNQSGGCYQDAILTCDVRLQNSCGSNSRCVAVNNSAIGVCQFNPNSYYTR